MQIEVVVADIFEVEADALVNPANKQATLWFGSHINERVRKLGGRDVVRERKRKGAVQLGEVVVTGAGRLPFRYIIHAAIMDLYDFNPLFLLKLGRRTSDEVLEKATRSALLAADALAIETVVFPPMAAGIGAMPDAQCAQIMLKEVFAFAEKRPSSSLTRVLFACLNPQTATTFREVLSTMAS